MKLPIQITFRHCKKTEAINQCVLKHAEHLDRFCSDLISCRVVIEEPHHHKARGKLYHVAIDLKAPGKEIIVRRDPAERTAHQDVYVAIRDAFDAARRQLEDFVRERRRDIKSHEPEAKGRVMRIGSTDDFGFIETPNGREIYFHKNSVLNGLFEKLNIGSQVRFTEEAGENGPQASTVELRRKKTKEPSQPFA